MECGTCTAIQALGILSRRAFLKTFMGYIGRSGSMIG